MRMLMNGPVVRIRWVGIVAALILALPAFVRADAMRYTVTDLGTLSGDPQSYPTALNNLGQVVGVSRGTLGFDSGFLYSDGRLTPLGQRIYAAPVPVGINDAGQIASRSDGYSFDARAINNSGLIVGYNPLVAPSGQAATMQSGALHPADLGTLESGGLSIANAVSNSGLTVGIATVGGVGHPVVFVGGKVVDLGLLPGASDGYATGVNDSGQVVGGSDSRGPLAHAFLYSDGRLKDLGTLGGHSSEALGINAAGQIVGAANISNSASHAFLYQGDRMFDLNDLVTAGGGDLTLTRAVAINDRGQIAVLATDRDSNEHSLLLNPQAVPEPASLSVLAAGAVVWLFRKRCARAVC